MEKFLESKEKAQKHIKIADHILTMTYPLVKDNKLLLTSANNILESLKSSIDYLLYYERLYKRIPLFPDNFNSKLGVLKAKSKRWSIESAEINALLEIGHIIEQHKKSPVEISKGEKFCIFGENYQVKTITAKDMKTYLNIAKLFFNKVDKIVTGN